MDKKEIRKQIKALKKQLSASDIKSLSKSITDRLLSTEYYKNATAIYPYAAYNEEVLTNDLILDAFAAGKKVALPKVIDDHMEFMYISSLNDLELGYCDIPEPVTTDIANEAKVLIIMPGIAFDPDLNRIGYGGGFYDKYLANHPNTEFTKVALTYDFQILDHLEVEAHDYKVDAIITPTKIFK